MKEEEWRKWGEKEKEKEKPACHGCSVTDDFQFSKTSYEDISLRFIKRSNDFDTVTKATAVYSPHPIHWKS